MNTFQPFTPQVWLCLLVTLLLCCLFAYVFSRLGLFDVFDPFILIYVLCEQSKKDMNLVKSDGQRIFLIFYVISLYIVTTGYKGALVSCLAIPVVPTPIGELLIKFNSVSKIIIVNISDTLEELAHSPLTIEVLNKGGMGLDKGLSPILDLLVDKYFTIPDPENPDGAMTRIREGKIARKA